MLFNLRIENVALIEQADINFDDGFNVLTGETGAGKSILIGSLNMLLGERIGREIIRNGEDYAYVEGLFYLADEVSPSLEHFDLSLEDDNSLIVSRKLTSDGKNICKVNGKTVSVSTLRDIGRMLINIHGQHDNQALLDGLCHINFLDAYIPEKEIFVKYRDAYEKLKNEEKKLLELDIDENEKLRKIDILTFEIDEIEKANITVGEEDELKEKKALVKNRDNLIKKCSYALDSLYENNDGVCAYNLFSTAVNAIETLCDTSEDFSEIYEKMNDILYGIEDVTSSVRKKLDEVSYADISADEIEERLDVIYRLKRKYGDSEEAILKYLENAHNELEKITSADLDKEKIKENVDRLHKLTTEISAKISKLRKEYAKEIEQKVNKELSELNMENAIFSVSIEETEINKNGNDRVEFLLSANKGEPEKPLSKIVSGGELSRIMLALKNILSAGDVASTLIFDEIDSGISGRAAGKVGQKLVDISKKKQVLCVTHLPQIASLSDHHYKISKVQNENKTNTQIKKLAKSEKIEEIALMIGGENVTKTTLAQAQEMVK